MAMTSIAAMVITPLLLRPPKSSPGVAILRKPATRSPQMSARIAGALPLTITARVTTTMIAASIGIMAVIIARSRFVQLGF